GVGGAVPGGGSFSDRLQQIIKRASSTGEITVLGQTKIISDERTNSLLIFASKDDMKTIEDIVGKLDVVLAQVIIESVILEVSLDNTKNLGVSYLQTQPSKSGEFNGLGALLNGKNFLNAGSFSQVGTNAAGALASGFNYWAKIDDSLEVTVQAL